MQATGTLAKMRVTPGAPVAYALALGDAAVDVNALVGAHLSVDFTGRRFCRTCGAAVDRLFGEGFCYRDFLTDPNASPCIVRPELCEAHLGGGRDPAWEARYHLRPHAVYLAHSGGVKVGVTGADHTMFRWIDQGAAAGLRVAETPYRRLAGEIEVALKGRFSDRTPWRKMLTDAPCDPEALVAARREALAALPEPLAAWGLPDEPMTRLVYPVSRYPAKVASVDLARDGGVTGRLAGARGQYLLFEDGAVFNVRKHAGHEVTLRA